MADYSLSTIAELLLLDERRVQQLSKAGRIPKTSRGKYELVGCVQGYVRYLRELSRGKDPKRIEEERKIAEEKKLRLQRERKKDEKEWVLQVNEKEKGFAAGAMVKDSFFNLFERLAPVLVAEKSAVKIRKILMKEANKIFKELANGDGR